MADASPGLPEIRRDLGRIERRQDEHEREVRDSYVRKDVYVAERDGALARIKRIEDGTKSWLYGVGIAVIGAACGAAAQILITRGR